MKKNILFCLGIVILSLNVSAQVEDGLPADSTIISFTSDTVPNFIPDTATAPLWQIGHSHKSFFGIDSTGVTTIMTDTIHPYPINANNWFVIKVRIGGNTIVDFWHKYQTDSSHDGGTVEYSLDHGATWQNIKGSCNTDSFFMIPGIKTENFYTFNDTLSTGMPSFNGNSGSTQYSRFQFFDGPPVRPPGNGGGASGGCYLFVDTVYIRFRFVSDSVADTLAGWEIDSIKIENDFYCCGGITNINKQKTLQVYPNPSYDGSFNFPALQNEEDYTTEVYNAMGEKILKIPYTPVLELHNYPAGLYFYRVTDGTEYYSGRLMVE